MDPISILGIALIGSYIGYRNLKKKEEAKPLLDVSEYHEMAREKKVNTEYKNIIDKFRKSMKTSFIMSELSYTLLTLLSGQPTKKDIAFYLTLINNVLESGKKNQVDLRLFTTQKVDSNLSQLYNVVATKDISKSLHEYDESLEMTADGDTLLINKLIIDLQFTNAYEEKDKLIVYKNVYANSDRSFIKVVINTNFSLLIIDSQDAFDYKYITNESKHLEKKKEYLELPKMEHKTVVDLKKMKSLEIKELDKKTNTKNIVSYVSFSLHGNSQKVELEKHTVIQKTKFNFVLIHTPSDQIILQGCNISE